MQVSSYLEAFLSVYGWMMYNTIYALLSMSWLIFLPFVLLAYDTFADTACDLERSYGHFKKGLLQFVMLILVLFTCIVPVDKISVRDTTISAVCDGGQSVQDYAQLPTGHKFKFDVDQTSKVPLFPSIAMRLSAGINNVIYSSMRCTMDVRNFEMAMSTVGIEDKATQDEVEQYSKQCLEPAMARLEKLSQSNSQLVSQLVKHYIKETKRDESFIRSFPGSPLLLVVMDGGENLNTKMLDGIFSNQQAAMEKFKKELSNNGNYEASKMYSQGPVLGINSDNPDLSEAQKTTKSGPVSCSKWWKGNNRHNGLESRVAGAANVSWSRKVVMDPYVNKKCNQVADIQTYEALASGYSATSVDYTAEKQAAAIDCFQKLKSEGVFTDDKYFQESLAWNATRKEAQETPLGEDAAAIEIGILGGLVGAVVSFFSSGVSNVLSAFSENAAGFYAQFFIYKIMMKLLQPMLLMGIYTFWGIYLIIGNYSKETVIKGLVLIVVIGLFPGLWAIADHMDAYLYDALVGKRNYDGGMQGGFIARFTLDMASTAFYVIFPMILLYLVGEAGGGSASRAVQSTDQNASTAAQTGQRAASGGINRSNNIKLRSKFKSK